MSGIIQGLLASFTSGPSPISGLIAYWKFANGADTTEYTGNYNLTKTGTPTIGTDRLGNTAGFSAFSTTKYFSHATFLDAGLTAWTFFVWFKATGTTQQYCFSKEGTGSAAYPFEVDMSTSGKLQLVYSGASSSPNVMESTSTINSGNWVFAVISGDSSSRTSVKFNINGGADEQNQTFSLGANSGAIVASTFNDYTIGARSGLSLPWVNGSIGECGFCNRVLTAAEKLRLYDESPAQYLVPGILVP